MTAKFAFKLVLINGSLHL